MTEPWKEIFIDVEPRGKEFRLGIDQDATAGDIMNVVVERCQAEGIDIKKWAKKQVGEDYQFVLLRKAEGNAILPPGILLGEVAPEIQNHERFKLGTQAVVGALPVAIYNRRIESLIAEFYDSSLREIYEREGWILEKAEKKKTDGNTPSSPWKSPKKIPTALTKVCV